MINNIGEAFLVFVIMAFFVFTMCVLAMWTFSYNLPHSKWKCVDEVQVGDDITNHECIAYKLKDLNEH